jgi:hypothetical protein
MQPDLDNEALMIARGQYSTLRSDAQKRMDALATEWQHVNSIIRDALAFKHISDCRPADRIAHAADRLADMIEQAREVEEICKQLSALKPIAWGS